MTLARALAAAVLVLWGSGCTGSADACVDDDDCFYGETCQSGRCAVARPATDVGADASRPREATGDMGSPDVRRGEGDADDVARDVGRTADDGALPPDATSPDLPPVACIADPFAACTDDEDPDNNDFPGQSITNMTRGCQSSGFVPLDVTITGRQCPLDPEDQYSLLVVECDEDEPGMIIEATLDVKDDCAPDLIHFDVEGIGTTCADPNPDSDLTLRCETLADGRRQIAVLWPGSSNAVVASIRWSIQTPDRNDVEFDYDLRVVVREP